MKSKLCSKYYKDYWLVAKIQKQKQNKTKVGSLSYILDENQSQIDQRINK